MDSSDKDAYTQATQDQEQANDLRNRITAYTAGAVKYGNVDRDWANTWLIRLGADPVTGSAEYRINVPITGNFGKTITANSRAEALAQFAEHINRVTAAGQITDGRCDGVYGVQFSTDYEPTFFSGPADVPTDANDSVPGLDGLKQGIRQMLKEGVTEQGWGHMYAVKALELMELPPLPAMVSKVVEVPVSGTTRLNVRVFEGDGDDVVQQAAARQIAASQMLAVVADEVGEARVPGSGDMGLRLVDGDDDSDVL